MTKKVKTFKQGIAYEPLSADPVNPKIGQQQYADGTVRKEGLWQYTTMGWCPAGGKIDALSEIGDVPNTYVGSSEKYLRVNTAEDGIEFKAIESNFGSDSYTPSTTGFGTPSGVTATYMQIGNFLYVQGSLTSGTPSSNEASVSLPAGFTIKTGQATRVVGYSNRTAAVAPYTQVLTSLATGDGTVIKFAYADEPVVGGNPLSPALGDFLLGSSETLNFSAFIEVNEGIGSGFSGAAVDVQDFTDLTDTPSTYAGQAGLVLQVAQNESELEFASKSTGEYFGAAGIVKQSAITGQDSGPLISGQANIRDFTILGDTNVAKGLGGQKVFLDNGDTIRLADGHYYEVTVRCSAFRVGSHYIRIVATGAGAGSIGNGLGSENSIPSFSDRIIGENSVTEWKGIFYATGSDVSFQVEHFCEFTNTVNGQGQAYYFGNPGGALYYTTAEVSVNIIGDF